MCVRDDKPRSKFSEGLSSVHTDEPYSKPPHLWLSDVEHLIQCQFNMIIEPRCEKTGIRGFRPGPDNNRAVPVTEYGEILEISDLGSRGIVLSV